MPNYVFDNPSFSAGSYVFDQPEFASSPVVSITGLSQPDPVAGESLVILLANGSGAEAVTYGGQTLTPDAQNATSITFDAWPDLHLIAGGLRYVTGYDLVVSGANGSDTLSGLQTIEPSGYDAITIAGWTPGGADDIFDDDSGVANGQQALYTWVIGNGIVSPDGTVSISEYPATLRYWATNDLAWALFADEVFSTPDIEPPAITVAAAISGITETAFDLTVTGADVVDATYNLYTARIAEGAAFPSQAQLAAGSGGGILEAVSDLAQANGTQALAAYTGQAPGSTFDVVWMLGDSALNYTAVAKLDVTMVSAVVKMARIPLVSRATDAALAAGLTFNFVIYDSLGGAELLEGSAVTNGSGHLEITSASLPALASEGFVVGHRDNAGGRSDDDGFKGYFTTVEASTTDLSA